MLVRKNISFRGVLGFAGGHLIWLTAYMALITALYELAGWKRLAIPWLPVSLVGTAVAFYLGFKNSQSYDRMWEARKIWGAIVNHSRSWGNLVMTYLRNAQGSPEAVHAARSRLIHRHIAWLYTLRDQLLVPTSWEHVSLRGQFGKINIRRREFAGVGMIKEPLNEVQLRRYSVYTERMDSAANKATQLIRHQGEDLAALEEAGLLPVLKHVEMEKLLNQFYDEQGKAERIKKFPFPRQYANMSFLFNCIFILMLPFGMVEQFAGLRENGVWLTIPIGVLVGWLYVVMELVGDYSENPFEGLSTDIPMLSICRAIEIDLLQMIGERDLPAPVQAQREILL